MNIKQNLVSSSKYSIKCPYKMTPEFVVVHNTANDASAANEIKYMISNDNQVSFHFAVDDQEVIQGLPLDRNAWACGDGANGAGNRKGIQVEICYSKSGGVRFENAEKRAAKLIATLLHERNWGIDRVKKHQDFSGKNCPHRTLQVGWASFINMVKSELAALKKPASSSSSETYYRVICGSYQSKANANEVKQKLEAKGYQGVFLLAHGSYYRVVAGSYSNRANAEKIKSKLEADGFTGVFLLAYQP